MQNEPPIVRGFSNLALIGVGGFSEVFSARQDSVDRTVALKVLRVDALADRADYARRQFDHEVKLMGQLGTHPNLVGVFDAGQKRSDRRPWLAMELFDASFADILEERGPLEPQEVVAVLRATASALGMAHHINKVHRDVKPANILLHEPAHPADHRRIALGDFGIARDSRRVEHTKSLNVLSLLHSAPEVLRGQPPVKQSDLYSLGSTAYALLAGRAPFEGPEDEDDLAFIYRAIPGAVPRIPRPDIPAGLTEIIDRLLAKNIVDRYQDTEELRSDLDRYERTTPAELRAEAVTRPTGVGGPTSRFAPPEPSVAPPDLTRSNADDPTRADAVDPTRPDPDDLTRPSFDAPDEAATPWPGTDRWIPADATTDRSRTTASEPVDRDPAPIWPREDTTREVATHPPDHDASPARTKDLTVDRGSVLGDPPEPETTDVVPSVAPAAGRSRIVRYVVAGLLVVAALGIVFVGGGGGDGSETAESTLPPAAEVITASDAPTDLKVKDNGTSVVVTWESHLPANTDYRILWTDENQEANFAIGKSGFVAEGLDPDLGYCFSVATYGGEGQEVTIDEPVGIRGVECGQ